jgi:dipeptidyl-peptidase-3
LLPGVDPDTLKAYGSTIEEARADLFALYYLADPKLVELGLMPDAEAYKASYIGQMQNGILTQLVRIKPGDKIEEAHMRNRALIARWAMALGKGKAAGGADVIEMPVRDGKTYVKINDYEALRQVFGEQLAEIQRIKSEGDFNAARSLVEEYGVQIDPALHNEILERYKALDIAPYKGFINPRYTAVRDEKTNEITDVTISYDEAYDEQMLRYSRDYGFGY